jgi:S-adenosylmethionine:tRNA ribosyltransferase-isomerase
LLIANRTRVIPARLKARKVETGGQVELLLLGQTDETWWEALVGGHRIRAGQRVELGRSGGVLAEIGGRTESGRLVRFEGAADVPSILREYGAMPLPPYIQGYEGDVARYQTVYAEVDGSVAAPTAGLHFTPELLAALEQRGVAWATVILHVGIGTFKGVSEADVRQHHLHPEWVEIDPSVVDAVGEARRRGGRVIAVGTTTTRALEHAAAGGKFGAYRGPADLFITPGHHFHVIDGLLTNFHLPKSSLLLLVSALASRERVLPAYLEAVRLRYRFYSFGDAMLIL